MKKDEMKNIVVPYGYNEDVQRSTYFSSRFLANRFLPPTVIKDIKEHNRMAFNRSNFYDSFLRRRETQISDTPYATIERDKKDANIIRGKYIHTPYIISERIFTELEVVRKVNKAVIISILGTLGACFSAFCFLWAKGIIAIIK